MTAIGLMVRPSLRQQHAPLACLLVAFDIQAPAFPPLVKRHGGLQARQRRAALVPSCNQLLASRRKNLRHAGIRCCSLQIWPSAYARFGPSRKAHKCCAARPSLRQGSLVVPLPSAFCWDAMTVPSDQVSVLVEDPSGLVLVTVCPMASLTSVVDDPSGLVCVEVSELPSALTVKLVTVPSVSWPVEV